MFQWVGRRVKAGADALAESAATDAVDGSGAAGGARLTSVIVLEPVLYVNHRSSIISFLHRNWNWGGCGWLLPKSRSFFLACLVAAQ